MDLYISTRAADAGVGDDLTSALSPSGAPAGGAVTVVGVAGEIDVYTAPILRDHLDELIDAGVYYLVVDLGQVTFMDSTALGVLVGRLKLVRSHGGSLLLACDQDRVLKVFTITGLDKVFQIYPAVDEAVHALDGLRESDGR